MKLIFTTGERVPDDARAHICEHQQFDGSVAEKIAIRPAVVLALFNANHTSSFACFWILLHAAAISWMSSSSPRSAGWGIQMVSHAARCVTGYCAFRKPCASVACAPES